ncbi:hypothetical protein CWI39_0202p0010 [Hamiltosporidium magnivora]|uniref:Uncharacterized protein n=1 Tax=Hamiltosporidium magnivora TaxID=148818 RepID=A0A4Q9LJF8_9MICR|nr:hypothetical protein CWI39_0202p0010 [Hamiltosporidium magnivora]
MNGMVEIFKKNFLVFCTFISFCKLTDFTGKYYDIDEYREYFMKKTLDLYNMETKQLLSQSISMDFTYLMFYDIHLELATSSILNYLESKSSRVYNINLYTADLNTKFPFKQIIFKANGITKNKPYTYQLLTSTLIKYKYDFLSVKIFSEVETPNENIDKSKMIKLFNEAFGRNTIDTIGSVLYEEDTLIRKTTLRTAMKHYVISFGFSCDPALYEDIILSYPLRNFEFKSFSHNTEFHYFLSLKNKEDYDYKFKILLKHSYITFEFNFNWCNAEQTVN